MKKTLSIGMAVLLTASLTSCATIFTGTKDSITFNSKPEGAKVVHKGVEKCTTPCTVEFPRSLSKQQVELKLDGFQTKEFKLDNKFNGVTLANILFGGLIGFGIDLATGSFIKYDTKAYNVEMEAKAQEVALK